MKIRKENKEKTKSTSCNLDMQDQSEFNKYENLSKSVVLWAYQHDLGFNCIICVLVSHNFSVETKFDKQSPNKRKYVNLTLEISVDSDKDYG